MKKLHRLSILILSLVLILVVLGIVLHLKTKGTTNSTTAQPTETTTPTPEEKNFNLEIPKIDVSAPVVLNVDGADKEKYDKALEEGVAQLSGSAFPGHNGNTFIFGHSSFYTEADGDYKQVFKDLNRLEDGDEITISGKSSKYTYKVIDKQIVSPDRVDFTAQDYKEKKLTLMTCWPIGSNTERLVVVANLSNSM